jgi:hypothetical protein
LAAAHSALKYRPQKTVTVKKKAAAKNKTLMAKAVKNSGKTKKK